jgi:hypothetical protein
VKYPPWQRSLEPSFMLSSTTWLQGLTLVRFSAQLKRYLWDRGCV